ncbi:MAG TPA: patatin-like phospholipase family protein [Burkholderiales bacterium]|nr:patatin-like phospholipase family protein [Burkholderiales bacterium]
MQERHLAVAAVTLGLALAGCAAPYVNRPLDRMDPEGGYRWNPAVVRPGNDPETLLILTFSGGGARAAAFSYGVLEELRRTEFRAAGGTRRMLDEVDLITGISGGSFTALSYALYGERLFSEYERRFLKRDVDGALIGRALDPLNWGRYRSDIAADYYDEVLFDGATFADLMAKPTPIAAVGATAISLGSRIAFLQNNFDVLCSDLRTFPLSRAAASSSAVPVILTPLTLRNYGGSCGYRLPPWAEAGEVQRDWQKNRAAQRYRMLARLSDGKERPYIHLVDGGIADNLGLSLIVDELQELEASPAFRRAFGIARLKHIALVVVNAHTDPDLGWEKDPLPPSDIALLLQAVSVPIDRSSYETLYALEDLIAEWNLRRADGHPAGQSAGAALPPIAFTVVNVSFDGLADAAERRYLLNLPTTLSLPSPDIDRLRDAAGRLLRDSPAFRQLVRELGTDAPPGATAPAR